MPPSNSPQSTAPRASSISVEGTTVSSSRITTSSALSEKLSQFYPAPIGTGVLSDTTRPSVNAIPALLARPVQPIDQNNGSDRVANIQVQLAEGHSAQATVSERSGNYSVKIVTSSSASAQRIASEVDTMRQNLDAAGLRLAHSDVSYRDPDRRGREQPDLVRPNHPQRDGETESIFTLSEVIE
jgi:hypothetical protein